MSSVNTLGAFLGKALSSYGVEYVFGIPGVHTVELYRDFEDSSLRHISPRHEQGAGFMADGYARVSGKPGVCFVISGPGLTNIATAMAQAYADSIPMLVISSVNAHGKMGTGKGWLHELPNQQQFASEIAAFSRTIHVPHELPDALAQAFAIFDGARPRPVHIEIPINVLHMEVQDLEWHIQPRMSRPAPDRKSMRAVVDALLASQRPVILAGGGAQDAVDLPKLAKLLDAPVIMTTNARGLLPPDDPLAVSISATLPSTRELIAKSDVVLALGTELGSTDYDIFEDGGVSYGERLFRIDIDPVQMSRGPKSEVSIVSDAAAAVRDLCDAVSPGATKGGVARAAKANRGKETFDAHMRGDLAILELIRDILPNSPTVGDSTQLIYSGNFAFSARRPRMWFNSATGFGTLGYGLPAAIGASLATPEPVVCISGDGGLQFSMAELSAANEIRSRIIMILHNNFGYGEIKSYMSARGIRPVGVDIFTPRFDEIAVACGWRVFKPADIAGLEESLLQASLGEGPSLIEIDDDFRLKCSNARCRVP